MEPINGDNFEWIGEVSDGKITGVCPSCCRPFSEHVLIDTDTAINCIPIKVQACPPSIHNPNQKLN